MRLRRGKIVQTFCRLMTSHQMYSNYSTISVSWPTMEWWKTRQPSQPDMRSFNLPTEFSILSLIQGVQNLAAKHVTVSFNFLHLSVQELLAAFHVPNYQQMSKSEFSITCLDSLNLQQSFSSMPSLSNVGWCSRGRMTGTPHGGCEEGCGSGKGRWTIIAAFSGR